MIREIARAKINLALHVTGRRMDGWHELDSVVAFTQFGDVLTLTESDAPSFEVSGPFGPALGNNTDNLVCKAEKAMRALYAQHGVDLPHFALTLEKNMPVASGIGGGSADAAAAIRLIMKFARSDLPRAEIQGLMLELGADVPVCHTQRQCRMQGIGEVIKPLAQPMKKGIVLVNPNVPCETAAVFKSLGLEPGQNHKFGINLEAPSRWRNDLTEPAITIVPVIKQILDELAICPGVTTVRMSGSGATCFALVNSETEALELEQRLQNAHPAWWVKGSTLS